MGIGIFLHGRKINSVFELLGTKENDITYSLGWALANCGDFRLALVKALLPCEEEILIDDVRLQDHGGDGFTDIELCGPNLHMIIEAKRGWEFPGIEQLQKYATRLDTSNVKHRNLVSMSEASSEFAEIHLPEAVSNYKISHMSWKQVANLVSIVGGTHDEKRLLKQFRTYLVKVVKMQNATSNLVYVASVGAGTPDFSTISWRAIINNKGMFFHPVGGGFPKEPPNYIAFRYDGRLQTIHHIEDWEITDKLHEKFEAFSPWKHCPHFLYKLGPAIRPSKTVKSGRIFQAAKVWAMLDLLLTCDTISEAREKTQERLNAQQD